MLKIFQKHQPKHPFIGKVACIYVMGGCQGEYIVSIQHGIIISMDIVKCYPNSQVLEATIQLDNGEISKQFAVPTTMFEKPSHIEFRN